MRLKIGFSRPRLNRQQFALSEEKQEDEWGCTFSIEQFAKLALSDENDISQLWRGWRGNSGFPRAHRCPALPRCLHTHPLWHCCPCQVIRLEVFLIRRWGGTPDICHFFYTDRIFKSRILHPKKWLKTPQNTKKIPSKSIFYAVFAFNLEHFTPERIFLHGHRPWCP